MANEKYGVEAAQEEAEVIQKKVASGEALSYREAEKKLGLEPLENVLHKKIRELEPIEESRSALILERGSLAGLVERPLLLACEELYDKNITTLGTSANKKDLEHADWDDPGAYSAYIVIDFDALSARNQEIGRTLGKVRFADGGNQLRITIPLTEETTFEEVQTQALEIAHKFVKQAYRVMSFTLEELRELYGYQSNDETIQPADFGNSYFWSAEHQRFFLSKEQYEKASEQVEEETSD